MEVYVKGCILEDLRNVLAGFLVVLGLRMLRLNVHFRTVSVASLDRFAHSGSERLWDWL